MHSLQDNEFLLPGGYDVIFSPPLAGASGDFLWQILNSTPFPRLQSANEANNSTNAAVLNVLSDNLFAIDDGNLSALMLLNLSTAFATVDHVILLQRKYRQNVLSQRNSFKLIGIICRRSTPTSSTRFKFIVTISQVLWGAAGLSSRAGVVPAVHRRTTATHSEQRPHLHANDTLIYEFSATKESQSSSTPVANIVLMFRAVEHFVWRHNLIWLFVGLDYQHLVIVVIIVGAVIHLTLFCVVCQYFQNSS